MKRASVDCECCGRRDLDADDIRKYDGYLVCARCRVVRADELSARRAREDNAVLSMLLEAIR